jgi:hypothetical protein
MEFPSTAGIAQVQSIPVHANFSQSEVNTILTDLLLPLNTPLSILAVEVFNLEFQVIRDDAGGPASELQIAATSSGGSASGTAVALDTRATALDQVVGDPLGAQLGSPTHPARFAAHAGQPRVLARGSARPVSRRYARARTSPRRVVPARSARCRATSAPGWGRTSTRCHIDCHTGRSTRRGL